MHEPKIQFFTEYLFFTIGKILLLLFTMIIHLSECLLSFLDAFSLIAFTIISRILLRIQFLIFLNSSNLPLSPLTLSFMRKLSATGSLCHSSNLASLLNLSLAAQILSSHCILYFHPIDNKWL